MIRKQKIDALIKKLGFEATVPRNRDCLDFKEVHIAVLKGALEAAFDAGFEAGISSR